MARGKHTIIEEIRLTGGPEIEAQLAKLGEAGRATFAALKAEADKLGKTSPFSQFINRQIRDFQRLGVEAKKVGRAYKELGSATVTFGRNVAILATAVTGAAVGFVAFVKAGSDAADVQNKAAQAVGLSIDQYGKLQFAFEQGNVGAEAFGTAMKKLNTNIDQAATGTGVGAKLFQRLGVSVKDANGNLRPTDEILQSIAEVFRKLPDGPTKSALAIQLFGKAGAAIVPIMNDGAAAMKKVEDQAVRLGLVFTAAEAKIGDDFGDAVNDLGRSATALQQHFALLFAPSLTDTFKAITDLIAQNREGILAFGQTLADQVAPVLKDFIAILSGKDSAVVNKNLLGVRDTVVSIGQAIGIVAAVFTTAFNILVDTARPLVEIFNDIFGTKFTAESAVIAGIIFGLTGGFKVLGLGIKAVGATWAFLVQFFKSGAGLIQIAAIGVVAVIATIRNAMDDIDTAIKAAFDSMVAFWNFITGQAPVATEKTKAQAGAIDAVSTSAAKATENFSGLVKVTDTFSLRLGTAADAVARVNDRIVKLGDGGQAIFRLLEDGSLSIIHTLTDGSVRIEGFAHDSIAATQEVALRAQEASAAIASAGVADIAAVGTTASVTTQTTATNMQGTLKTFVDTVGGFFTTLGDSISTVLTAIVDGISAAISAAGDLLNAVTGGGGSSDDSNSFAGGGHVRGRGTGTSDSILSWLSNGEYVVRTKAVSKYGLGMLNALNSLRLPKSLGFASGGLVSAAPVSMARMPAFAQGGPVGRPLSLTIGGETFAGLIAPDTVADKLVRYANGRSVRSAGRRPSWSH